MKRISEKYSELSFFGPDAVEDLRKTLELKSQPCCRELFLTSLGVEFRKAVRRANWIRTASRLFEWWPWLSNKLEDRSHKNGRMARHFLIRAELRAVRRILGSAAVPERQNWFWFSETYLTKDGELIDEALKEDEPALYQALRRSIRFLTLLRKYPRIVRRTERKMDRMREAWRAYNNDKSSASTDSPAWDRWLRNHLNTSDRLQKKGEKIQAKRDKIADELESIYEETVAEIATAETDAFLKAEATYHARYVAVMKERRGPIDVKLKEASAANLQVENEAKALAAQQSRSRTASSRQQEAARERQATDIEGAFDSEEAQLKAEIDRLERQLPKVKDWRKDDDQSLLDILERINRL